MIWAKFHIICKYFQAFQQQFPWKQLLSVGNAWNCDFSVLLNRQEKTIFYNNKQEAIITMVTTVFHQWYVINTEHTLCHVAIQYHYVIN